MNRAYEDAALDAAYRRNEDALERDANELRQHYADTGVAIEPDDVHRELVAAATEKLLDAMGAWEKSGSETLVYDTNAISTVFRKKNGIRLLTDAINSPHGVGVYYINKTEAQNLYAGSGVQFPGSSLQDGLNHSIFDAGSPVNRNFLE